MIVRLIVALLLGMNLAVAGWWWLGAERAGERPTNARAQAGNGAGNGPVPMRLVLLGEAELDASAAAGAESSAPPEPFPSAPRCLRIGPFATPADMRAASARLQPVVARMQVREAPAELLRGYRVFLPAMADRDAALAAARRLSEAGMRDYYVVTAGSEENSVSLGLFRDLGNAEKRREEVRALGLEPRLEPRTDEVVRWWLEVAVGADVDWAPLVDQTGVQATDVDCF